MLIGHIGRLVKSYFKTQTTVFIAQYTGRKWKWTNREDSLRLRNILTYNSETKTSDKKKGRKQLQLKLSFCCPFIPWHLCLLVFVLSSSHNATWGTTSKSTCWTFTASHRSPFNGWPYKKGSSKFYLFIIERKYIDVHGSKMTIYYQ